MSSKSKSEVTRREFVKTGSAAALGAPVAVSLVGKAFGSQASNEIRCAVVGTGGRGRNAHIKSIFDVPGARVVAVAAGVGTRPARGAHAARRRRLAAGRHAPRGY